MYHTSDFNFRLPQELVASRPLEKRDASRMLVVSDNGIEDKHIRDFVSYLRPGDVVVFNNSRVVPVRFKADSHEFTLHTAVDDKQWWGFCRKFNKIKKGSVFTMSDGTQVKVKDKNEESGLLLRFYCDNVFDVLEKCGNLPLPPYMKRKEEIEDRERYQTVYAQPLGSMAAPTAGLHFTDELLSAIEAAGAKIVKITLHVGAGTWMQVKTENLAEHKMHSEWCCITPEQAEIINNAKRVIAVGTTSMRTLESAHQLLVKKTLEQNTGFAAQNKLGTISHLQQSYQKVNSHIPRNIPQARRVRWMSKDLNVLARKMRENMTPAEKKLWYALNKRRLGVPFRKQYVLDNQYVADFFCVDEKLVIEVEDRLCLAGMPKSSRVQYFYQGGVRVIRFWEWDVCNDLESCLAVIRDVLHNDSFRERMMKYKEDRKEFLQKMRMEEEQAKAEGAIQSNLPTARVMPICQTTDIFITPGYKFGAVDVLLTNFHLPKSTLFMLVSAFAGLPEMRAAYEHAVEEKYRFFSYGDCCLLFRKDV